MALLAVVPDKQPAPETAVTQDASSYIVQATTADEAGRLVVASGGHVTARLPIINAVGALLNTKQADWLRGQAGRVRVYADLTLEVSGDVLESDYPTLIGAAELHAQGITGEGITIAVLDTGLWKTPAIRHDSDGDNRVLAEHDATHSSSFCFDDCGDDDGEDERDDDWDDDGYSTEYDDDDDWSSPNTGINDWNGHGTHITSVMVGSGRTPAGRYQGIAPDANIVAIRAFEPDGSGTYLNVIKALQWVVQRRKKYDIRILNLSFGASPASHYWDDPVNQAVMAAWSSGIAVVAAAGNNGPGPMTIGVPGKRALRNHGRCDDRQLHAERSQ